MTLTLGSRRADGKWPVTLTFAGGPNMFGGHYPDKTYRKLYSPEQAHEAVARHGTPEQQAHYTAERLGLTRKHAAELTRQREGELQCAADRGMEEACGIA